MLSHHSVPDFRPYLYELLLPEDVTPKGAVVVCADGDHGDAAVPEGYQVALDFNKMGYQCFLLQNRTNHNPWTQKEAGVDGARAIRMVRQNAAKYCIDPDNIAFAVFSNGGVTGEGNLKASRKQRTFESLILSGCFLYTEFFHLICYL